MPADADGPQSPQARLAAARATAIVKEPVAPTKDGVGNQLLDGRIVLHFRAGGIPIQGSRAAAPKLGAATKTGERAESSQRGFRDDENVFGHGSLRLAWRERRR